MLLSEVVTLKIKGMSRPQPLFIVLLLALTLLPKKPLPSLAQLLVQGEPHPELLMQLTLLVDIQLDLELLVFSPCFRAFHTTSIRPMK
jgi:hypothetical protein